MFHFFFLLWDTLQQSVLHLETVSWKPLWSRNWKRVWILEDSFNNAWGNGTFWAFIQLEYPLCLPLPAETYRPSTLFVIMELWNAYLSNPVEDNAWISPNKLTDWLQISSFDLFFRSSSGTFLRLFCPLSLSLWSHVLHLGWIIIFTEVHHDHCRWLSSSDSPVLFCTRCNCLKDTWHHELSQSDEPTKQQQTKKDAQ